MFVSGHFEIAFTIDIDQVHKHVIVIRSLFSHIRLPVSNEILIRRERTHDVHVLFLI